MFMFYTIFIFANLLRAIYAAESITLLNSEVNTDAKAAEALAEIGPNQALPLILFQEHEFDHKQSVVDILQIPEDIHQAVTANKRMVKGTKFLNWSDTQMFFCPKQDSEENCLTPQEFNEPDVLECAKQPVPQINLDKLNIRGVCGTTGVPYYIHYDICPNHKYVTVEIPFYGFCYDETKNNTIYTAHFILSPNLLKSKLLYREQRVKYPIVVNDKFKPSNLNKINVEIIQEMNSLIYPGKPSYELQMLVPDANMALALWRKTTYRNFNLEWQHKTLIPFWNQINQDVRTHALQMSKININIMVRTGVINVDPVLEDETQMSNIWVSMITTMLPSPLMTPKGVVIFMNNFIRKKTNDDDSSKTSSNGEEETIDQFCKDDHCLDTLRDEIENMGGRVRCCSLSKSNDKVRNVFGVLKDFEIDPKIQIFDIPGVTSKSKILKNTPF